jgi:hypothetical protein
LEKQAYGCFYEVFQSRRGFFKGLCFGRLFQRMAWPRLLPENPSRRTTAMRPSFQPLALTLSLNLKYPAGMPSIRHWQGQSQVRSSEAGLL